MEDEQEYRNFFEALIDLYHQHRISKFPADNIFRGRSSSVSSDLEDLFTSFVAKHNHEYDYYIDQAMKFGNERNNKYPDIVIQGKDGVIRHLIDMKADIGWNRDRMYEFCSDWDNRIDNVKGKDTTFKEGCSKNVIKGKFSERLHYHVVIVSQKNSNQKKLSEDYQRVKDSLENVSLYILSDGEHPNEYKYEKEELLEKIKIKTDEFDRLLNAIKEK